MWPIIGVASVGRTDAPSCRLLFSRSANEGPGAAESRPNESSGVWARIESWVVQSVRRTTISPECTGWIRGGDGNVSELLFPPSPAPQYQVPQTWPRTQSKAHRCRSNAVVFHARKVAREFVIENRHCASELSGTVLIVSDQREALPLTSIVLPQTR